VQAERHNQRSANTKFDDVMAAERRRGRSQIGNLVLTEAVQGNLDGFVAFRRNRAPVEFHHRAEPMPCGMSDLLRNDVENPSFLWMRASGYCALVQAPFMMRARRRTVDGEQRAARR
jgi:hypothetical protein